MKNIYLTLLFLTIATFGFGQFNATYSASNINGPFENGEEVQVDWIFSNATNHFVTANAKFQFVESNTNTVISTTILGSYSVSPFGSLPGTFTFTFGSGCDIPAGDYSLNMIVSYDHAFANDTPVNIKYNGTDFCDPYVIPGSSWTGPDCIIPIFSNQNFTGGCCEDVVVDIVTSQLSKTQPCTVKIQFTVSGVPTTSPYTYEWSDGYNSPVRYLGCGKQTYTLTVFWTSADGTACSVTTTEQVQSPCYCAHEDLRIPRMAAEGEEEELEVEINREIEVYPNPSNGRMYLKIANGQSVYQIQVFNTLGQLEQDIRETFVETQELTLNNTTTGLRYLRLFFNDGKSKTIQVFVQ